MAASEGNGRGGGAGVSYASGGGAEGGGATQNQALNALVFLYREVVGGELDWIGGFEPARRGARLPDVLSRAEVQAVLARMEGTSGLIARLLYGTGLRLLEWLRLRVKDVDFDRG